MGSRSPHNATGHGRSTRPASCRSCGACDAAHGGDTAVVAVGQFLQRRALRAPSGGLFLLGRCFSGMGGGPWPFPWALARLLPSAVRVRIRSRSTSAKPPSTAGIKRPVLVPVSAHGSAEDRNCALASTMRLTMPNRSKVLRARRSIRVTVTTSPGASLPSMRRSWRRSLCAPVTFSLYSDAGPQSARE
jgi:hypothetical protein